MHDENVCNISQQNETKQLELFCSYINSVHIIQSQGLTTLSHMTIKLSHKITSFEVSKMTSFADGLEGPFMKVFTFVWHAPI